MYTNDQQLLLAVLFKVLWRMGMPAVDLGFSLEPRAAALRCAGGAAGGAAGAGTAAGGVYGGAGGRAQRAVPAGGRVRGAAAGESGTACMACVFFASRAAIQG